MIGTAISEHGSPGGVNSIREIQRALGSAVKVNLYFQSTLTVSLARNFSCISNPDISTSPASSKDKKLTGPAGGEGVGSESFEDIALIVRPLAPLAEATGVGCLQTLLFIGEHDIRGANFGVGRVLLPLKRVESCILPHLCTTCTAPGMFVIVWIILSESTLLVTGKQAQIDGGWWRKTGRRREFGIMLGAWC